MLVTEYFNTELLLLKILKLRMYRPFNIFVNLTKHIVEIASLMPQYVDDVVAGPLGYSALTLEYNLKKNMLVHIVI